MSREQRKRACKEALGREGYFVVAQRRKKLAVSSPTATPMLPRLTTVNGFFNASDYVIMNKAHTMMKRLVFNDGPYRRKLLELATFSIANLKERSPTTRQETASRIVELAWGSKTFYWAPQSDNRMKKGMATAFASGAKEGTRKFQVIAISSSFIENDGLSSHENSGQILETALGKKTLLLFFKKIKHEFLHLVHRYLETMYIENGNNVTFTAKLTSQKYTPFIQATPTDPSPEVGDHDEEEDWGGPILPRYHNKKLSDENPLCVHFNGEFLVLSDAMVDQLLNVDIYFDTVQYEGAHNTNFGNCMWSILFARAVSRNILETNFFNPQVTNTTPRSRIDKNSAARFSSPTLHKTPKAGPVVETLPLWRVMGEIPLQKPVASRSSGRAVVSRSSSPVYRSG